MMKATPSSPAAVSAVFSDDRFGHPYRRFRLHMLFYIAQDILLGPYGDGVGHKSVPIQKRDLHVLVQAMKRDHQLHFAAERS